MFEEKQLLAVQMELKERIEAEKQSIRLLQSQLRREGGQATASVGDDAEEEEEAAVNWEQQYRQLERDRDRLLSDISRERNDCARLRAEIEMIANRKRYHVATGGDKKRTK